MIVSLWTSEVMGLQNTRPRLFKSISETREEFMKSGKDNVPRKWSQRVSEWNYCGEDSLHAYWSPINIEAMVSCHRAYACCFDQKIYWNSLMSDQWSPCSWELRPHEGSLCWTWIVFKCVRHQLCNFLTGWSVPVDWRARKSRDSMLWGRWQYPDVITWPRLGTRRLRWGTKSMGRRNLKRLYQPSSQDGGNRKIT